jgi:hypothetical protein
MSGTVLQLRAYRGGKRVCFGCGGSLAGMKRTAITHEACGREVRRKRQRVLAGQVERRKRLVGGLPPAQGTVRCPECGNNILLVRVHSFALLGADGRQATPWDHHWVSGRKLATCVDCEWRGTVARTREKAAA